MKLTEAIASLIFVLSPPLHASEVITVAINEYCPYVCDTETNKPHGLAINVLEKAFPSPEHTLVYRTLPHLRSRAYLISGEITAYAIDLIPDDSRITYPQHFRTRTLSCAYTQVKSAKIYNPLKPETFDNARLGRISYYTSTGEKSATEYSQQQLTYINPGKESAEARALKMLISNRFDVSILPSTVSDYLIEINHWGDRIKRSGCEDTIYEETFLLSRRNPNSKLYAKRIDAAYRSLVISGKFQKLVNDYGIKSILALPSSNPL